MEHLFTYAIFFGLALSQWGCHKLIERHAKKAKDETQTAVHGVHGGIMFTLAAHPVTLETLHEWLVHALIYSGH